MTTRGKARRGLDRSPIDLGDGDPFPLYELPRRIQAHPGPVVVRVRPGDLDERGQRLYATLGVLVRFDETAPPMR